MNRSPGPTLSSAVTQKQMTSTPAYVSRTRSLSRWPSSVRGLCRPGVSTSDELRVGPVHDAADRVPRGLRPAAGDGDLGARPGRWSASTCRRWAGPRSRRSRSGRRSRGRIMVTSLPDRAHAQVAALAHTPSGRRRAPARRRRTRAARPGRPRDTSPSVTSAAASKLRAPLEAAAATAPRSADGGQRGVGVLHGRGGVRAAVGVAHRGALGAARCAGRARAAAPPRASVTILASSGSTSLDVAPARRSRLDRARVADAGCAGPAALSATSTRPPTVDGRAGDGHPAERAGEQPADGVDVLVRQLDAVAAPRGPRPAAAR